MFTNERGYKMNIKTITQSNEKLTKSVEGLLNALADVELNDDGTNSETVTDEDGVEIVLGFQSDNSGPKPVGVHTITIRKNGLNTIIVREFELK